MNNLYRIFVLLLITVLFSTACSSEQSEEKISATDTTEKIKVDTVVTGNINSKKINNDTIVKSEKKKDVKIYKYICPLGCKNGKSEIKGNCPDCGMELIENPDYITKKQTDKK